MARKTDAPVIAAPMAKAGPESGKVVFKLTIEIQSREADQSLTAGRSLKLKRLLNFIPVDPTVDHTARSQMIIGGIVCELARRMVQDGASRTSGGTIPSSMNLLADAADSFKAWTGRADVPSTVRDVTRRVANMILPEELGEIYQYLRRPAAKAISTAALNDSEKISGNDVLAVTQFLTDDYMVSWLTSTSLNHLDSSDGQSIVVDPAVGGGAFLIAAYRNLVSQVGDRQERRVLSDKLLSDRLRGYDLDPFIAQLAAFALWVEASRVMGTLVRAPSRILTGGHPTGGALDPATLESVVAESGGRRLVFLTNPPFLARRLMGPDLKGYLEENYPMSGNDLCAAFLQAITDCMRPGDIAGIVHQSTIRHLRSLQSIASYIASRQEFITSVDVGAKAFRDISGEKVRATLSIMKKQPHIGLCGPSAWAEPTIDVSRLVRGRKEEVLRSIGLGIPIPPDALPLEQAFRAHSARHKSTVSHIARPMQGSSTGDNARFVKFAWEIHAGDPDWRQASKGGGYSRWAGLRRYVVYWGDSGSKLKEFRGSALRNPLQADAADIVWSDTGSFGLSARIQDDADIFMASGPGIRVEEGSKWALAALLNSQLATTWLKFANPKLTITPSALGAIPVPEESWHDPDLDRFARFCHAKKVAVERHHPDSLYWTPESIQTEPSMSASENMRRVFFRLLRLELEKLELEHMAEVRVRELFGGPYSLRDVTDSVAGKLAWELPRRTISESEIDKQLASIPVTLRPGMRSHRGAGVDGLLESISLKLDAHPISVFNQVQKFAGTLRHMQRLSQFLLHHKMISFIGYSGDRLWDNKQFSTKEVLHHLGMQFTGRPGESAVEPESLVDVHRTLFHGRPVVWVHNENLLLKRLHG